MSAQAIVFQHIKNTKGKVDLKALTSEILKANPDSRWDNSHWAFYRTQITSPKGRYTHLFTDEVKENLKACRNKVERPWSTLHSQAPSSARQVRGAHVQPPRGTEKWPEWETPGDEEELLLANVLLPYVRILAPELVAAVAEDNNKNIEKWTTQFQELGIRPEIYLWRDSPVAFPGIRRHAGTSETAIFRSNPKQGVGENALLLDDNSFPKEVWSFALRNLQYGKKNPPNYSLAHILDHKDHNTRNAAELKGFVDSEDTNLFAGLYTSCVNAAYVPTNFVKPTDHNSRIRRLLIQVVAKYYGEVCCPLPYGLEFSLETIEDRWRLEQFSPPKVVGNTINIKRFLDYRNRVIDKRVEELMKVGRR